MKLDVHFPMEMCAPLEFEQHENIRSIIWHINNEAKVFQICVLVFWDGDNFCKSLAEAQVLSQVAKPRARSPLYLLWAQIKLFSRLLGTFSADS